MLTLTFTPKLLKLLKAELTKAQVPAGEAIALVEHLNFFQARNEYSLYCLLFDYLQLQPRAKALRQKGYTHRSKRLTDGAGRFVLKYQRLLEKVLLEYPGLVDTYDGRGNFDHAAPIYRLMQA